MTTPTEKLPTGYLQGLLSKTSPKPWEYHIVTTVISGEQLLAERYTHRICNEHGSLMEETGGWEMEGRDPDFELAALAPALTEEVIQSRETIAELKAQITAAETKAPAHPEYLETLEDYENAPVGTIVETLHTISHLLYLVKLNPTGTAHWYMPAGIGHYTNGDLVDARLRVIYWPEPEVVE